MAKTKPPYAVEFKKQMVELVRIGRTPASLAKEFGVSGQSISAWVARDAIERGQPLPGKEGLTSAEREELAKLRRENRQLRMERDILSKATAWFAVKSEAPYTGSTN
jgi:transposase